MRTILLELETESPALERAGVASILHLVEFYGIRLVGDLVTQLQYYARVVPYPDGVRLNFR